MKHQRAADACTGDLRGLSEAAGKVRSAVAPADAARSARDREVTELVDAGVSGGDVANAAGISRVQVGPIAYRVEVQGAPPADGVGRPAGWVAPNGWELGYWRHGAAWVHWQAKKSNADRLAALWESAGELAEINARVGNTRRWDAAIRDLVAAGVSFWDTGQAAGINPRLVKRIADKDGIGVVAPAAGG